MTKQAKSELGEMERFASDMRKRIKRYNPVMEKDKGTKVVVDTKEGGKEGADKAGGVGWGYRSNLPLLEELGVELRLTRSSSSNVGIPMATKAEIDNRIEGDNKG